MTNPQDPFATPADGGSPSRPPQAPAWEQPSTPAWEQPAAAGGQPAWGQPQAAGWGTPPAGERRNGLGTAALVVGLVALLTSWFGLGGLLGIVAIVLGVLGLGRVRKHQADNRGMAIAGIALGVVSILVAALFAVGTALLFNSDSGQRFADCVEQAAGDQAALDACEREFSESVGSTG